MENTEFQPITSSIPPISVTPEISQPVVESIITPPKPSNFLRIFFIVIALILFGILIGVLATRFLPMSSNTVVPTPPPIVTETPTPIIDEIASWQTYTDTVGIYEVKYPLDATLSTNSKPAVDIVYMGQTQIDSGRIQAELSDGYKISISYEYFWPSQTLTSAANNVYLHSTDDCPEPEKAIVSPLIKTVISSETAMQFSIENCYTDSTTIMVVKEDKLYTISSMYPAFNQAQRKHYQDQTIRILSTFKFLNQEPTIDTSNWKTYTNSSLGFQFKYPNLLKLSETDSPGETGYSYEIHLAYANNNLINIGGISKNYSEGRGGVFTDTQGYVEKNGNFYCKSINSEVLIQKEKVTKITNPNGVEMLVIIGGNTEPNPAGEYSCAEPGTGNIGVLINLKDNGRYSGMGILYGKKVIPNILTEKDSNQILSTFKFIEPTAAIKRVCPTTEWIDCMPSPDMIKPQCDAAFLSWAKANCPGFKGAAL